MSFDYAKSKATADRLLTRFGQAATLRRPGTASGPAYNPTIGSPSNVSVTVVVLDYANREIDGARILAGDKKVMLARAALTTDPTTADQLVIGGVAHAIVAVSPFSPGGTTVYFEIQARR